MQRTSLAAPSDGARIQTSWFSLKSCTCKPNVLLIQDVNNLYTIKSCVEQKHRKIERNLHESFNNMTVGKQLTQGTYSLAHMGVVK